MGQRSDIPRLVGDLMRLGTIESVNLADATCRMQVGDIVTGDLPWLAMRAGATLHWSPPTVGEQALLLCPEGDHEAGIAILGLYSTANAAPSSAEHLVLTKYADGALISYDAEAHALSAILPDGATATITAPGGLTVNGPLTLNGSMECSGDAHFAGTVTGDTDVVGAGKSLKDHKHSGVKAGTDFSGAPA